MVLDVGTMNKELRNDPLYLGLDQDRINGDEYYEVRLAYSFHCLRSVHSGGALVSNTSTCSLLRFADTQFRDQCRATS